MFDPVAEHDGEDREHDEGKEIQGISRSEPQEEIKDHSFLSARLRAFSFFERRWELPFRGGA